MKNGTKVRIKPEIALVGGLAGVVSDQIIEEDGGEYYLVTLSQERGPFLIGDELTMDKYELEVLQ